MSKTLETTIHEAELPAPAPGGEDFNSYIARVAHAAAFIGAAWAIANGPQVQGPTPEADVPVEYEQQPEQVEPTGTIVDEWTRRPEGEVTDGPLDEDEHEPVAQDAPRRRVREH